MKSRLLSLLAALGVGSLALGATPTALKTLVVPGQNIYLMAPSIHDRALAEWIVEAAFARANLFLLFDRRAALAPEAYTAHLSVLPNTQVRLARSLRQTGVLVLTDRRAYLYRRGQLEPLTAPEGQRLRKRFASLWRLAKRWVYVPKPPPGYVIYKQDPVAHLMDRGFELLAEALEADNAQ